MKISARTTVVRHHLQTYLGLVKMCKTMQDPMAARFSAVQLSVILDTQETTFTTIPLTSRSQSENTN